MGSNGVSFITRSFGTRKKERGVGGSRRVGISYHRTRRLPSLFNREKRDENDIKSVISRHKTRIVIICYRFENEFK